MPTKEEMAAAAAKAAAAKAAAGKKTSAAKEAPVTKEAPKKETAVKAAKEKAPKAAKEKSPKVVKEEAPKAEKTVKANITADEKKKVKGLRIAAIVLWVLAVAAEVGAFFAFSWGIRNGVFTNVDSTSVGSILSGLVASKEGLLLVIALVVDMVLCIIGGNLWKKSNEISPCLANSALVRTLWHQLGVIMVLICFLPIGIFMLVKSDKLDKKTRTVLLVLFAALFVGATAASVDYDQPSAEEVKALQEEAIAANAEGAVYWTRFGKSYHFDENCTALARSKAENRVSGTLEDAFAANRWDPCDYCAGGKEAKAAELAGELDTGDELAEAAEELIEAAEEAAEEPAA